MSLGADDLVTLTIDAKEVTVPRGTLIIRVAEQLGIEVPRFCDHPLLEPAGACRQCYVQVEGQPKLLTSCTATVMQDMVVRTQNTSELAREAQVANLEFLLLNHPLDCPVCDRGGECPLQDQALAFGPGDSRFSEAKRVFPKPIPLSPLIGLDRERCILCARCTRFCDEISGDRFIELFERGAGERVSISAGEDFESPFSGNTVQICPVGALTSTPYRFVARPFDLRSSDSVCQHCSAGCNVRLDVRRGRVVRVLARDNLDVNDAWICDKGRFAFGSADAADRITTPLIRDGALEPASFGEVLSWVADRARGRRTAFLTGGRLMDEDHYALSKLARKVFGTNDLDHRRDAAGAVEDVVGSGGMAVTYADVERASVILVAGLDAEQEVPILHLRLRKAARAGARIFTLHPRRTRLGDVAQHIPCVPGDESRLFGSPEGSALADVTAALGEAGSSGLVIAGPRLAYDDAAGGGVLAAAAFASMLGSRFTYVSRRANDRGGLRAGAHPRLLPGGRSFAVPEERAEVEVHWGPIVTSGEGRDWRGILRACTEREIDVLFLIGVDPLRDYPDAALVRYALENVPMKVVQSLELGSLEPFADAFLPAASWGERDGHTTSWEGRSQRLRPVRGPAGISLPDWEIFASLALAMGGDLGFETLDELHEEMGQLLAPREIPDRSAALSPPNAEPPTRTEGPPRLFTYPLLVDEGRLSEGADALKAALEREPWVEVHPDDAVPVGISDGDRVVVTTHAGRVELPARVTGDVSRGSLFVPFNQPGFAANTLLSGSFTADATIQQAGPAGTAETSGTGAGAEEA